METHSETGQAFEVAEALYYTLFFIYTSVYLVNN